MTDIFTLENKIKQIIDELKGFERFVFAKLYAGGFSKKLYRLYEYQKKGCE